MLKSTAATLFFQLPPLIHLDLEPELQEIEKLLLSIRATRNIEEMEAIFEEILAKQKLPQLIKLAIYYYQNKTPINKVLLGFIIHPSLAPFWKKLATTHPDSDQYTRVTKVGFHFDSETSAQARLFLKDAKESDYWFSLVAGLALFNLGQLCSHSQAIVTEALAIVESRNYRAAQIKLEKIGELAICSSPQYKIQTICNFNRSIPYHYEILLLHAFLAIKNGDFDQAIFSLRTARNINRNDELTIISLQIHLFAQLKQMAQLPIGSTEHEQFRNHLQIYINNPSVTHLSGKLLEAFRLYAVGSTLLAARYYEVVTKTMLEKENVAPTIMAALEPIKNLAEARGLALTIEDWDAECISDEQRYERLESIISCLSMYNAHVPADFKIKLLLSKLNEACIKCCDKLITANPSAKMWLLNRTARATDKAKNLTEMHELIKKMESEIDPAVADLESKRANTQSLIEEANKAEKKNTDQLKELVKESSIIAQSIERIKSRKKEQIMADLGKLNTLPLPELIEQTLPIPDPLAVFPEVEQTTPTFGIKLFAYIYRAYDLIKARRSRSTDAEDTNFRDAAAYLTRVLRVSDRAHPITKIAQLFLVLNQLAKLEMPDDTDTERMIFFEGQEMPWGTEFSRIGNDNDRKKAINKKLACNPQLIESLPTYRLILLEAIRSLKALYISCPKGYGIAGLIHIIYAEKLRDSHNAELWLDTAKKDLANLSSLLTGDELEKITALSEKPSLDSMMQIALHFFIKMFDPYIDSFLLPKTALDRKVTDEIEKLYKEGGTLFFSFRCLDELISIRLRQLNKFIEELKNKIFPEELAEEIITYADIAERHHWIPGRLLSAKTYTQVATAYLKFFSKIDNPIESANSKTEPPLGEFVIAKPMAVTEKSPRIKELYRQALLILMSAKKIKEIMETTHAEADPEEEFNNALYGSSTHLKTTSLLQDGIKEIETDLASYSNSLAAVERQMLMETADLLAQASLREYYAGNETSPKTTAKA